MSALYDDVVLLAFGADGLRALSLRKRPAQSQLNVTALAAIKGIVNVYRVEYDNDTDTLLLLVQTAPAEDEWELVSLRLNGSEWLEVQRLPMNLTDNQPDIATCGSRVLLGDLDTVHVFDVSKEHLLSDAGTVPLQNGFYGKLTCTGYGNQTLVAAYYRQQDTSVSVERLRDTSLPFEQVASVDLGAPSSLLWFCEDLLLVAYTNWTSNSRAVVSMRLSGSALTDRRELLNVPDDGWMDGRLGSHWRPICSLGWVLGAAPSLLHLRVSSRHLRQRHTREEH